MEPSSGIEGIRELVQRVFGAYQELDQRLGGSGGIRGLVEVYERVREDVDRIDDEELVQLTRGIKGILEALLRMDYELRAIHRMKRALGGVGGPGEPPGEDNPA